MRKKYLRVLLNRLRSAGPGALLRQGWNAMAVARAAAAGGAPPAPVSATLVLTYRCNQRCVMCNFPGRARRDTPEMSTVRARQIIGELALMGTSGISFYGGEPLLRKDIVELTAHAHSLGLMTHISTNGMLLSLETAQALVRAGADLISISLDGGVAETHDRQRGVPGAFQAVQCAVESVRAARAAVGRRCHCALAATLTAGNADETGRIIAAARALRADTLSVFEAQELSGLAPWGSGAETETLRRAHTLLREEKKRDPNFIDNSEEYIRTCLALLDGKPPPARCCAPYSDIFIDTYEDVYACNYFFGMARMIGNLRGGSVAAFWRSNDYRKAREDLRNCALCNYMCHRELSLILNRMNIFRIPRGFSRTAV
ncbi:MAG: radical SAM protein [Candidatus Aureabacteria bacterium]|nr:radical SAM protein [Candidatus Auribacterota bacterium]